MSNTAALIENLTALIVDLGDKRAAADTANDHYARTMAELSASEAAFKAQLKADRAAALQTMLDGTTPYREAVAAARKSGAIGIAMLRDLGHVAPAKERTVKD